MKAKYLVVISLLFICYGPSVFAGQLTVRSVYSDSTGVISIVVEGSEVPEGQALNESYFSLLEDDKVTVTADAIKHFRDSERNLALVLCIDASGSVAGEPLEEIKLALKSLLSKELFKPKDRIALTYFINKPVTLQYFGNRQENLEKVDDLTWFPEEKNSVLWDALYDSLEQLNELDAYPPELKRILVITDGKDERSNKKREDVREQALKWDIAIDVVARVRKDYVRENLKKGYVPDLNELADKTGGRFAEAKPGAVDDAIELILKEVMATPVVYFRREIATDGKKTKKVGIQFQLSGPGKLPLKNSILAEISRSRIPEDEPQAANFTKKEDNNVMRSWIDWIPLPPRVTGLLLALLALLAIASIVLVGRRLLIKPNGEKSGKPDIEPQPDPILEPEPEPRAITKIGGFHFPAPEPGKPTAVLIGVGGHLEGRQFSIEKESFNIGASRENDLHIAEDDYVSAKHANLRYTGGSLSIYDMESKNKTYVNQDEVTDRGFDLNLGDRIRIGMSTFKVEKAPS